MSGLAIVAIVAAFVVLAALVLVASARRRDTETAVGRLSRETVTRDRGKTALSTERPPTGREVEKAAVAARQPSTELVPVGDRTPAPWVAPDPETIDVTRRQFLNRGIINLMGFSITAFGLACIGFLWPQLSGGFGSKIRIGKISDIKAKIAEGNGFFYLAEGRMYITEYPADALDKARHVYAPPELAGMEVGVVALYQRCVHLGCRVPPCITSQWFECPCHGSQYNQVGEKKGGPAPRGLDHFAMEVAGSGDSAVLTVNTGQIIQGPPIGTNTTGQEAEGPHCI